MADESDDPEMAMERLEAALERIARLATQSQSAMPGQDGNTGQTAARQVADGLDTLIGRLRAAIGGKPD